MPSMVLILSEDQVRIDYSFTGHKHVQAPRIDKPASVSKD